MQIKISGFGYTWVEGDHHPLVVVLLPLIVLRLVAFALRLYGRRHPRVVRARVAYTQKVEEVGGMAGRVVDAELWGRLSPAFSVGPIRDADVARLRDADDPHVVSVVDGRTLETPPTLASHGFELRESPSSIRGWERTDANADAARREAEAIVQRATGASQVIAFDHTWRSSRRSNVDSSVGPGGRAANVSSAVGRVHTDNTPASAVLKIDELVARAILPPCVRESTHRAAIINVWRAYGSGASVEEAPLGCVKWDTVEPNDTFPYTLAHAGRCGVNGSVRFSARHGWHYFDGMTPEEVLLFVNYEEPEAAGGAVRQVYHAALDVLGTDEAKDEHPSAEGEPAPTAPPCPPRLADRAERLSLEVRVVAIFPRAAA